MWCITFALITLSVLVIDASNVLSLNSTEINSVGNKSETANVQLLSEKESIHKVAARHLGPMQFLREKIMSGIKRPLFSSKIEESRPMIIVKKVVGKPDQVVSTDRVRYAPRSLDMGLGGLMNYNYDMYGNNPSGTPNSLNHLYLPEMIVKDHFKPLGVNEIGNLPGPEIMSSPEYTREFDKPNVFRGNPIDLNYHGEDRYEPIRQSFTQKGFRNPSQRKQKVRVVSHPEDEDQPYFGPSQPHSNPKHNVNPEGIFPSDDPPGYDQVEGDAGIRGILELANLINSNGFPEQLAGISQNTNFNFHPDSPGVHDHDEHSEGDFDGGQRHPSGNGNRDGRQHFRREEDEDYDNERPQPGKHAFSGNGKNGRYNSPQRANYGARGHRQKPISFAPNEEEDSSQLGGNENPRRPYPSYSENDGPDFDFTEERPYSDEDTYDHGPNQENFSENNNENANFESLKNIKDKPAFEDNNSYDQSHEQYNKKSITSNVPQIPNGFNELMALSGLNT